MSDCCGGCFSFLKDRTKRAKEVHNAFVFIKPHAVTPQVKSLVKQTFIDKGLTIISEGAISSEDIDKKMLIDKHYGSIAARCMTQKPADLPVSEKGQGDFKKTFGLSWQDALQKGLVFNGADAASKLKLKPIDLGIRFDALPKGSLQVKLGGGFYCGKMSCDNALNNAHIFVINAFYYRMREIFVQPGKCIYTYQVEWDASKLAWGDFRGKVLGATDPKDAAHGSLRNKVYRDWKMLDLDSLPDTGNNGFHASASPLEALAERNNWLGIPLKKDYFGQGMVAAGIPFKTIEHWCNDPAVPFEGKQASLFDLLEDLSGDECLKKAVAIHKSA